MRNAAHTRSGGVSTVRSLSTGRTPSVRCDHCSVTTSLAGFACWLAPPRPAPQITQLGGHTGILADPARAPGRRPGGARPRGRTADSAQIPRPRYPNVAAGIGVAWQYRMRQAGRQ